MPLSWTPFPHPRLAERWFDTGRAGLAWRLAPRRQERLSPFRCAPGRVVPCSGRLGIGRLPLIQPPDIHLRQAAKPRDSPRLLLVGALVLVQTILVQTGYARRVLRGKVGLARDIADAMPIQ